MSLFSFCELMKSLFVISCIGLVLTVIFFRRRAVNVFDIASYKNELAISWVATGKQDDVYVSRNKGTLWEAAQKVHSEAADGTYGLHTVMDANALHIALQGIRQKKASETRPGIPERGTYEQTESQTYIQVAGGKVAKHQLYPIERRTVELENNLGGVVLPPLDIPTIYKTDGGIFIIDNSSIRDGPRPSGKYWSSSDGISWLPGKVEPYKSGAPKTIEGKLN